MSGQVAVGTRKASVRSRSKGCSLQEHKDPLWICIPSQIQVLCWVRKNFSLLEEDGCRNSHPYLGIFYPGISFPAQPLLLDEISPFLPFPNSPSPQHLRIPWNSPARDFPCPVVEAKPKKAISDLLEFSDPRLLFPLAPGKKAGPSRCWVNPSHSLIPTN